MSSEISSKGWLFVTLSMVTGMMANIILVLNLPGFRRFTHHCPTCRVSLAQVEPKLPRKHLAIIFLASLATIFIVGLFRVLFEVIL